MRCGCWRRSLCSRFCVHKRIIIAPTRSGSQSIVFSQECALYNWISTSGGRLIWAKCNAVCLNAGLQHSKLFASTTTHIWLGVRIGRQSEQNTSHPENDHDDDENRYELSACKSDGRVGDFLSTTLRRVRIVNAVVSCIFQHTRQTLINISSAFFGAVFFCYAHHIFLNSNGRSARARTTKFIIPARVCSETRFTSSCTHARPSQRRFYIANKSYLF